MMKISQYIEMCTTVLNGGTVVYNGYTTTSDGTNWIIDGRFVSPLEKERAYFDKVFQKCLLASCLLRCLGHFDSNMFDSYSIVHSFDGMVLLVKNEGDFLTFVFMVCSYVAVEQIDKNNGTMKYDYFWRENNETKHGSLFGNLSLKSKDLLAKKLSEDHFSVTQNFYYDMYFEDMRDYLALKDEAMLNRSEEVPAEENLNELLFLLRRP